MDAEGNITTLGRGGSDTTAVAIAAALDADECQIFTDVDGVYTTDPRLVPEARRLECISFDEMLEMAGYGSKVLQVRSVEFAQRSGVRLRVLSTFEEGAGTLIANSSPDVDATTVTGIACSRDEAEITAQGLAPGQSAELLVTLAAARIDVDAVRLDDETGFSCTVLRQDYEQAREILALQLRNTGGSIDGNARVAKVTLVGRNLLGDPMAAARVSSTLAAVNIRCRFQIASELRISVVVDEIEMENAARALHHEFRLNEVTLRVKAG